MYPWYTDRPVNLGDSGIKAYYTNTYNKFNLLHKTRKIISYKTGDDIHDTIPEEILFDNDDIYDELGPEVQLVSQDTYYLYNDETRNLTAILQKKGNSIGETSPQWLITGFTYDESTNNLKAIIDPAGNETELVYDTEYQTYIVRDMREIKHDNDNRFINEFTYDDTGRMTSKRSCVTDSCGNPVQNYVSASAVSYYSYDNLDRLMEIQGRTENNGLLTLTHYKYDDRANTLTKYQLVEQHENDYLALKTFLKYDSLDRKTGEETYRLDVALSRTGNGEYQIQEIPATEILTSKKVHRYHPVYTDKILKTAFYEDEEIIIFLTENSYDPYGRIAKIRVGYSDTMNNLDTAGPVILPDTGVLQKPCRAL